MPQECHFLPGEAPGLDASIPISDQVASPVHLLSCFSRIINHACDSTVGMMFESGLPACPDPGGNGRNCVPREIQALSEKFGYSDITAVYLVATRDLTLDDEVVLNQCAKLPCATAVSEEARNHVEGCCVSGSFRFVVRFPAGAQLGVNLSELNH